MRQIVTIAMILAFCACHRKLAKNPAPAPTEITPGKPITIAPPNARNSLDYIGRYKGILPCADCDGLETAIELSEEFSYRMTWRYLGKGNKVFEETGKFKWNESGDQIILTNKKGKSTSYVVGENMLSQQTGGQQMDKAVSDRFVLRKVTEAEAARTDAMPMPAIENHK